MVDRNKIINNIVEPAFLKALDDAGFLVEIVDKNGVYVYCTKDDGELNYTPLATVGRKITDVLAETYSREGENQSILMKTLEHRRPFRDTYWPLLSADGKDSYWLVDTAPIHVQGECLGAICLSRPFHRVRQAIENVSFNTQVPSNPSKHANKTTYSFADIYHKSKLMKDTIEKAKQIARNISSVMITGETGTGKELFAQSIHDFSSRKNKPFIAINCNAIPQNLLESTLFGTSKGAFTGAINQGGLFEEASGGTVFLDEINSMDMGMQTKLLRAIDTKKIRRVGSNQEIPINIRFISATNVDPLECIAKNTIREDLFYRLAVTTLEIPPLRERKEDILALATFYINKLNLLYNKRINEIAPDVEDIFHHALWPGNVRELRHVVEHAIIIVRAEESTLRKQHLPYYFLQQMEQSQAQQATPYPVGDYKAAHAKARYEWDKEFTSSYILNALKVCHNNILLAAEKMKISRRYLYDLMEKYDIKIDR